MWPWVSLRLSAAPFARLSKTALRVVPVVFHCSCWMVIPTYTTSLMPMHGDRLIPSYLYTQHYLLIYFSLFIYLLYLEYSTGSLSYTSKGLLSLCQTDYSTPNTWLKLAVFEMLSKAPNLNGFSLPYCIYRYLAPQGNEKSDTLKQCYAITAPQYPCEKIGI